MIRRFTLALGASALFLGAAGALSAQQETLRIEIPPGEEIRVLVDGQEVPFTVLPREETQPWFRGRPGFLFRDGESPRALLERIQRDGPEVFFRAFPAVRPFQGTGPVRLPDRRVSLNAVDISLQEAVEQLFRGSGARARFEEGVDTEKQVTLVLNNVQFGTALRALCESAEIGVRPGADGYLLLTADPEILVETTPPGRGPGLDRFFQRQGIGFGFGQGAQAQVGGGRGTLVLDGRPVTYGIEGEEFVVEAHGPARVKVEVRDRQDNIVTLQERDLPAGAEKIGVPLKDVPDGGSLRLQLQSQQSELELTIRDQGRTVAARVSSRRQ